MKKELIVFKDPKSPISEVFRTLRTNIQFMDAKKKSRIILVTSTFASEGKSWVSSNLAVTFAQTGKKVLLIDADMRKGRQYTIFGVSPKPGLSNYLANATIEDDGSSSEDISDYVQSTEVDNLFVIPAGSIPPNPSELLNSSEMVHLLERLRQLCDVIIIDGTPSQLVTDSLILARLVDSTIIVTACKETKKEDLSRVVNNIINVGGKIAGVVLNKVPISSKKYEEKYYYSSSTSSSSTKKTSSTSATTNAVKNTTKTSSSEDFKKVKESQGEKVKTKTTRTNTVKKDDVPLDRANDILRQINDYLDKEKNDSDE